MHSRQTKLQPLVPSCNRSTNDPNVSPLLVNKVASPVNVSKQALYSKANQVHKLLQLPISDHGPNTENACTHTRAHVSSNLLNPLASVYSSCNELKFVTHRTLLVSPASLFSVFLLLTYVTALLTSELFVP